MSWRNCRATLALRDELDTLFPNRSKASDGTIGDAAHASRTSDHNPWVRDPAGIVDGVVTAIDLTDDDKSGADMAKVVTYLTQVSHDKRIKYLIHEGRIYSSYPVGGTPAWAARPYSGPNGHFHHLHVSVNSDPASFDDGRPWGIAAVFAPPAATHGTPFGLSYPLKRGMSGKVVETLQTRLTQLGYVTTVDGDFGPRTESMVKTFQWSRSLAADGVVGAATARALGWRWVD